MEVLRLNEIIKLIISNLNFLIKIAVATAILSAIVSYIIPVWFKSTTIIYPAKLSQIPVNETAMRHGNISDFGETVEAEQTIELLNAENLRERVVEKFDLYKHYKIPRDIQFARTFVLKQLDDNIAIKRTKFNSISITVIDKNAQMAANIANSLTDYLDTVKFEITQARAKDLLMTLGGQREKQKALIDSIKVKIDNYSKLGVMSQFQRAYLLQAFADADAKEKADLKKLVDVNILYGEDFDRVEKEYNQEIENGFITEKYVVQTNADANAKLTQKFIVDKAMPAEKKYYPVRWLMVASSVVSILFLAIGLLLFKEKWPSYRKSILS